MKKSSEENRSVSRAAANTESIAGQTVSQMAGADEELQGKFKTTQLAGEELEEPAQGKFNTAQLAAEELESPAQGKFNTTQLAGDELEEPAQGKFETTQQEAKENNTGMPDNLKSGIESLSGMDASDVRVHYNSSKPAQMNAHAYAQGTNIHVSPGQEQHVPHEAWHTVQQKQGRVQPTTEVNGTPVNDNVSLETEADVMGAKAAQFKG
jgi:hypothetical protein